MSNDNNYDEIFEDVYNNIKKPDKNIAENESKKTAKYKEKKPAGINDLKKSVLSIEALIKETKSSLNLDEIKEKLENISFQVDSCNKTVLTDLYSDISSLKDLTDKVGKNIESLQNAQNIALTSAEFDEYQKHQLDLTLKTNENLQNVQDILLKTNDNISKEVDNLREISKSNSPANIDNLRKELESLHANLKNYIEQIVVKIEEIPRLDDISSVISDLTSVSQKSIKQTNDLIKNLQFSFERFEKDFENKDFEKQITKISEIYDSLNIINAWIEKVGYINQSIENVYSRLGENIDFDDLAEKVDIIYDNISELNNWTMKIDNIDGSMSGVQAKLSSLSVCIENTRNIANTLNTVKEFIDSTFSPDIDLEDISNKIDIVYENLSSINEWAGKADIISEDISKLNTSFEEGKIAGAIQNISEKVSNIDEVISNEMIASKIDLIYENIGLLNEWAGRIDGIAHKSEELDLKYIEANDGLNIKIDEMAKILANAGRIIQDVPDIKDKLEELSGELYAITCTTTKDDTESYIYTLLDIESDFLKLHKALDDSAKVTADDINSLKEGFSELADDISSISVRTNKLILSADDANKEFRVCLDEFRTVIGQLEKKQKEFNPEHKHIIIESKIHNLIMLMQKSIMAGKNLNSAFAYLAEWIDATGAVINNIQSDIAYVKTEQAKELKNSCTASDDIKILAEGLDAINKNISELQNSSNVMLKSTDSLPELKDNITGIVPCIEDIASNVQQTLSLVQKSDDIANVIPNAEEIKKNSKAILNIEQKIDNIISAVSSAIENDENSKSASNIEQKIDNIANVISGADGVEKQAEQVKAIADKIDNFKNVIPYLKNIAKNAHTAASVKTAINGLFQYTADIKELNPVLAEMAAGLKSSTQQTEELKKGITGLSDKISKLEETYEQSGNNSELKSMITGVMVQLNTALTPEIDTLNEKIDKITEENGNKFTELETLMKEKIEIQSKQINALEEKIENLNGRFDKLTEVMSETDTNYEIKDVLNYIAAQISSANETIKNQSAKQEMMQKVADKLSSFDNNINKIVSYIEEE